MKTPLPASSTPARRRGEQPTPSTIAFRLDDEACTALAGRAAALGVSVHELARRYVLDVLSEAQEREVLIQTVAAVAEAVDALRADQARACIALLMSAGKVHEQEATDWVTQNLSQPCSPSPTP